MENQVEELLEFFKALADANRLKIVGLLAQDEYTVEEMAEILKLRPSTVSHHLTRLSKAGLYCWNHTSKSKNEATEARRHRE